MGLIRSEAGKIAIPLARPPSGCRRPPSGSESSDRDGSDPRLDGSHAWWYGGAPDLAREEPHRDRRGPIRIVVVPIPKGGRLPGWGWRPSGSGRSPSGSRTLTRASTLHQTARISKEGRNADPSGVPGPAPAGDRRDACDHAGKE